MFLGFCFFFTTISFAHTVYPLGRFYYTYFYTFLFTYTLQGNGQFFNIDRLSRQYIFEISHFYSSPLPSPNTDTRSACTASFARLMTLSIGIFGIFYLCATHKGNLKNAHENVSFPEPSTSAIQGFASNPFNVIKNRSTYTM